MSDISTTSPLLQEKASGPYHYYEGMDTTLTRRDIIRVAEELFDVRNNSRTLGLVLGLEKSVVDAIHVDRRLTGQLLQVIAEFLERKKPRPTWRVIVNALRSPLIGEHGLARHIEAKYSVVPATKSDILTTSSPLQEKASEYYEGMDTILTRRDLVGVAEELLVGVGTKSRMLGLVLGLQKPAVEEIHMQWRDPGDQLRHVIAVFLRQKETRPTWRVIVKALRSPLIEEHALAKEIERRHSGKRSLGDLSKANRKGDQRMVNEQSFVYTGKELDFIWKDAGINLYFPAATCMDIEVSVECMTHVEEDCIMPRGYRLMPMASMAYKISASAIFPAPVRVRVQHCAIVEREDALVYMVAHDEPPYRFKLLHGGRFLTNESYGEIELKEFCLITIFYNIMDPKMSLAVFVAYLNNNTIHILVTKNLPANCNAVRSKYKNPHEHNMTYYYLTAAIVLDISENENGWRIKPTCQPTSISMRDIHAYEPGSVIPKVELQLEWQDSSREPQRAEVEVKLQGGSMESLTLICGQQPPQTSSPQSCGQQLPPAEPAQPPRPLDQSGHLPTFSTQDDERDFISAKDVLVKYLSKSELRDLFNRLGLADHTLQDCFVTAGINDYSRDMLKAWKKKQDNVLTSTDYPGGPTWENLRKALTNMGHHGAVDELK